MGTRDSWPESKDWVDEIEHRVLKQAALTKIQILSADNIELFEDECLQLIAEVRRLREVNAALGATK